MFKRFKFTETAFCQDWYDRGYRDGYTAEAAQNDGTTAEYDSYMKGFFDGCEARRKNA
jgi:hypothetical protein